MAPTKTELIDLFWRSLWTFIATFIGGLTAAGTGLVDASARDLALIAATGAVLTLVKVFASNKLGTGTATDKASAPAGLPQPVASNNATPA
jgi:hypothetical protein